MSAPAQSRVIGLVGATSVIAGTMLGVGILLTPPVVAAAVGGPLPFFLMWILGAVVALAGADAYAELGVRLPEAGGDVAFQDAAFGSHGAGGALAFASGAMMFGLAFAGSIAAIAVAVGTWQAPAVLSALGLSIDPHAVVFGGITWARGIGLVVIWGLTLANLAGARVATVVQTASTGIPLGALTLLALWVITTGVSVPPPAAPPPTGSLADAWAGVYFAFAGWPAIVYIAGEVRDPSRVLPRAMLGGTLLVSALYLLLCAAFVSALGMHGLALAGEAGTTLAIGVLGPEAGAGMAALVLLALLASINGTVLGGARVAVAMARRGTLPAALAHLSPGAGVPVSALLLQGLIASALVLSGTFETIIAATSLAMMLITCLSIGALAVLRRRDPKAAYSSRAWPVGPAFFVLVTLVVVGFELRDPGLPVFGMLLFPALACVHLLRRRLAARGQ